jgi:transcriptional regulator with GAF, ATPase, and Fis domain
VHLPPLRDRGNDILLLAQQHLETTAAATKKPVRGIAPEAAAKLRSYSWPGNVRELHMSRDFESRRDELSQRDRTRERDFEPACPACFLQPHLSDEPFARLR